MKIIYCSIHNVIMKGFCSRLKSHGRKTANHNTHDKMWNKSQLKFHKVKGKTPSAVLVLKNHKYEQWIHNIIGNDCCDRWLVHKIKEFCIHLPHCPTTLAISMKTRTAVFSNFWFGPWNIIIPVVVEIYF